MRYFDKLPTISYKGHTVKNLLARAKLSDATKANDAAYYQYTVQDDDRVDLISNNYYDHPGFTWLIWMANEHIDPYYDMPLSEVDFNAFIKSKYGSDAAARRKVKCYRTNWYFDLENISVDEYEALSHIGKKFYDPVVDPDYNPVAYKRKREDLLKSTNRVVGLTHDSSISFTVGEEIYVGATYAFVTGSNNGYTTCQHVTGQFEVDDVINGKESGATATVLTSTVIAESISDEENLYWEQVSFYDYERELNEAKRHIRLIDVRYRSKIENDLKRVMQE